MLQVTKYMSETNPVALVVIVRILAIIVPI